MTDTHPEIPRQLGEYTLTEEIGRGPQCTVWKGQRPGGNEVALKILEPRYVEDEWRVARFEQEAGLAQSLGHPHIVRVHQVVSHVKSPLPFYVMDYLAGGNIGQFRGARRAEFITIGRVLLEVCAALEYLHGRGLVHCDIKPTNILLDQQQRAFLTDFGVVASSDNLAETGPLGGTIAYMAPEQFAAMSGQDVAAPPVDPRADIYALGTVMYDILTGELPFHGSNRFSLMYQRLHSEPRRPSELRNDIPAELERVILKALAREPASRFQTAAEVAAALRSCCA